MGRSPASAVRRISTLAREQLEAVGEDGEISRRGAEMASDAEGNFDFSGVIPGSYIRLREQVHTSCELLDQGV